MCSYKPYCLGLVSTNLKAVGGGTEHTKEEWERIAHAGLRIRVHTSTYSDRQEATGSMIDMYGFQYMYQMEHALRVVA